MNALSSAPREHHHSAKNQKHSSRLRRRAFLALFFGLLSLLFLGRLLLLPLISEATRFPGGRAGASNQTIRYGMAKHPPLFFRDAEGYYRGYLADLLRALSEGEPWELAFVEAPGDDLPGMLNRGEVDLLSMVPLPHRAFNLGKVHHYATWYTFFTPPGTMILSFLDLQEKRIAMQGGFYGTYELRRILNGLGIKYEMVETETVEEALDLLHRGEVHACSAEQIPSANLVRRYGFWRSPVVFAPSQVFFAAAEGRHSDILARLDEKLRAWHQNPLSPLKDIQRRWFYDEEFTFFPEWVRWSFWGSAAILVAMSFGLGMFFWKEKTIKLRNAELRKRLESEQFLREATRALLAKTEEKNVLEQMCQRMCEVLTPERFLLLRSTFSEDRRRVLEVSFEYKASEDPPFSKLLLSQRTVFSVEEFPKAVFQELRSQRILRSHMEHLPFLGEFFPPWMRENIFFSLYAIFEGSHLWGALVLKHSGNPLPSKGMDITLATFAEIFSAHLLQKREAKRLVRLATTDTLTGLPNRRSFFEALGREIARSRRHGQPFSLILCDIDFFKEVNDTHGHDAGDNVLRQFGRHLRKALRREDLPSRYGGEEFGVLLPETDLAKAVHIAERLRTLVEQSSFSVSRGQKDSPQVKLTASFGVAQLQEDTDSAETLFSRADLLLYEVKHEGRNSVLPSPKDFPLFAPDA